LEQVNPQFYNQFQDNFQQAFSEPLARVLDLDTWSSGQDMRDLFEHVQQEVDAALQNENQVQQSIRRNFLGKLQTRPGAPASAGVYRATLDDIARIHRGLLFTGRVQACDGTSVTHDTLPLSITQIGVTLVSYNGDTGSWSQRLFRRDLRNFSGDMEEEVTRLLENRDRRKSFDSEDQDGLSLLARRAVLTFAERRILVEKATAPWRLGHGSPISFELLTGGGVLTGDLLPATINLYHKMMELGRFIFVPSAPRDRVLLTIANALNPLEFAIVDTLERRLTSITDQGRYDNKWRPLVRQFAREVGSQILVGLYRATASAPAMVFYAHRDHVVEAAHIALADSLLQAHRGFPMLIDLADKCCQVNFGASDFTNVVRMAYANADQPWRYLTERETRKA
jgi:hypothetical protein